MFQIVFRSGASGALWQKGWAWLGAEIQFTSQWLDEWGFKTKLTYGSRQLKLCCLAHPSSLSSKEARQIWLHALSSSISDYFVEKLENQLLLHLLRHTYGYRQLEELKALYPYCEEALYEGKDPGDTSFDGGRSDEDEKVERRKQMIYEQAYHYLAEADQFHLEGFYHFRLKEYRRLLHEAIWHAVGKFVLDRFP